MQQAAKRKTTTLTMLALASIVCAPAVASSRDVLQAKNRAEIFFGSGPCRVEPSPLTRETASSYYDPFREVASDSSVAPKKTAAEMAEELTSQANKNRVSVRTAAGKRIDIDLRGKGHFDKATGKRIETPHVHEGKISRAPNGRENIDKKTKITRPATPQDIRTAREILKRRGDL